MFEILKLTSTDNPSTNSVLLKKKHSVDKIYYFGPNLKSQEKKDIVSCHNAQI